MFKKLLANLSFNPGLLEEVILYQKRMQREARLRLYGLMLVVLAILLQVVASANGLISINTSTIIIVDGTLLFITTWLCLRSYLIAKELEVIRQTFISVSGM